MARRVAVLIAAALLASCGGSSGGSLTGLRVNEPAQNIARSQIAYRAVPLPAGFVPQAMMKDGRVVGSAGKDAAIYFHGQIQDLGAYPGHYTTVALGANAAGDAVGFAANTQYPNNARALLFRKGKIIDLGALKPQSIWNVFQAVAINDRGDIFGVSSNASQNGPPSLTRFSENTPPHLVPTPSSLGGLLFNVNAAGQYVFSVFGIYDDPNRQAYIGYGNTLTRILPQYKFAMTTWINDEGTAVGTVNRTDSPHAAPLTAFVYKGGGVTYLPMLPHATDMEPTGINNDGTIVGKTDGGWQIFVYRNGEMTGIGPSIQPRGQYNALPGLSEDGSFAAYEGEPTQHSFVIEPESAP